METAHTVEAPSLPKEAVVAVDTPQVVPANWPSLQYLTSPRHSAGLTELQRRQLQSRPESWTTLKIPLKPSQLTVIRPISDLSHPACNQFGLFAAQHLQPGTLIIPYLGLVHSNDIADTDPDSDYDISLDRGIGLSIDASKMGNEARMVNDYRGVPRPNIGPLKKGQKLGPNAEFKDIWLEHTDGTGELGIGIFVMGAGKSGKGKAGIAQGDEILVNYGKGFWKERLDT